MAKRYKLFISLILLLVLFVGATSTFAYLYVTGSLDPNKNHDGVVGTVSYEVNMYHENTPDDINAKEVILNGVSKPNVYELNVSNMDDPYHINKFRVNFKNNSNIDTYIRVKPLSTLTFTYENNQNILVEVTTAEQVNFIIDNNLWHYDNATGWYYYKDILNKDLSNINFIEEGLEYDLRSPQYSIQFTLNFEAVQSHLGPSNNGWGDNPPWGGNW